MVIPIVAYLVGLGFVAAVAVLVAYWTKILQWALNSFLPWVDQNMPALSGDVRNAFVVADKLAAPALATVKKAWQQLRQVLLQQVAEFEQLSGNTWLLRITSWVRVKLNSLDPAPVAKRIQTEQVIRYEELPKEIREQLLRKGETTHRIDVTEARDLELGLSMSA